MPQIGFVKAQGAGNDFLIVERADLEDLRLAGERLPAFARQICDRRLGVGADGLEVLASSERPDAVAKAGLWNSDGSEAEISGNGTRCVAAYLTALNRAPDRFGIETDAGVRAMRLVLDARPSYQFLMSVPPESLAMLDPKLSLRVGDTTYRACSVDVGNPQCVVRVRDFAFDWRSLGAAIERLPEFPQRTNVSFVRAVPAGDGGLVLEARFWERGAGATLSSGTGALGAAHAARRSGWIRGPVRVRTQGGELTVDDAGLTGPAALVASGSFEVGL